MASIRKIIKVSLWCFAGIASIAIIFFFAVLFSKDNTFGEKEWNDPQAEIIIEAFKDIDIKIKDIKNATYLSRFDGLKGNTVLLKIAGSDPEIDHALKLFNVSNNVRDEKIKIEEVVTIPSRINKEYPWYFRFKIEEIENKNKVLIINGFQPYD